MLGLFYFIIIAIAGAVYYSQREESRKKSRDVAWQYGRNDYRDQYGRYWWNNTRCKIDIRDGHEVLVDWNDPEIVYWDYTWEKDKPRRDREEKERKEKEGKRKQAISKYIGSYIVVYESKNQIGKRCEVVTGKYVNVFTVSKNRFRKAIYYLSRNSNGHPTYSTNNCLGEDISYDEYRFLTGQKYNEFNRLVEEKDPTWRIQYIRDHGYEKYFNLEPLNQSSEVPNK